ncbi:hypothetical protein LTR37_017258 [Vermiconidia calcicola]|uniref:Uncharacterized protein n=1 Tax=Vermiconidia calcicola TaxID=1690605 RepID=A0ACC3MKP0_9PEZI|nr:hypothetical protein LTR37_017258 [Vermiconidia calcicola]
MDVSSMLSNGAQEAGGASDIRRQSHQYPTRHGASMQDQDNFAKPYFPSTQRALKSYSTSIAGSGYARTSPAKKGQKHVVFQLIDPEDPRIQARLPMRVMISKHDTTDSIITTVKNFYGLYEYGVSFENKDGISIIAAYDNFENDMTVYVRTVPQPIALSNENGQGSASPKKPSLGAPFEMRSTLQHLTHSPSKAAARSAGARSLSPPSDVGRRSASTAPGGKPRAQRTKSKDNDIYGDADGYSSGDNGGGSVTSSRRSKTDLVNPEISVQNIVEGGRRKRAFESSELPLFVPPQVPMSASISSISPQRRPGPPNAASPYAYSNQQTFSYPQPLPSPQSYGGGFHQQASGVSGNGFGSAYPQPARQLRGRPGAITYPPPRQSACGIMPTPDPTVGSAISDEDVALQLMRLGDPMAFSNGRTSTSTVDDAFSGKAELASSDEEGDDEDDQEEGSRLPAVPRFPKDDVEPQRKKPRLMNDLPSDGTSGEDYEDQRDTTFANSGKVFKPKGGRPRSIMTGFGKPGKPRTNSMTKPKSKSISSKMPMSPSSMPAPSRKNSVASTINFQHQLGTDEEDLSSKPRCQRCRKSKKGCDRQRPCGRCKDAGIGIEGCVSEDEGNGRKGRFGRHMGVPVKKGEEGYVEDAVPQPSVPANGYFLAPALPDKSKKRKR